MAISLVFDCETTGFKTNYIIQLAYLIFDETGIIKTKNCKFDLPDGIYIDEGASKVHGVYKKDLEGSPLFSTFVDEFVKELEECDKVICHNASFDIRMVKGECERNRKLVNWDKIKEKTICTMQSTTSICKIPHPTYFGKYKWAKLNELHQFLFNEDFDNAHDALGDVIATYRCYIELKNRKILL